MAIIKNCKKLGTLNVGNPFKKIYVRFDDPPLTRQENKRLSDKLYEFRRSGPDGATYKIQKGKLLEDDTQIDESWPTINIRPHIMHFRRLAFSYAEVIY